MDILQSLLSLSRFKKKRKTILLPMKSSNKRLIAISILILLEKRISRNFERLSIKSDPKLVKKLFIPYSKNCSTIQKLSNCILMKRKPL